VTATRPPLTATVGVNVGSPPAVWMSWGPVQVAPPSLDVTSRIAGSMATSSSPSPTRAGLPVLGSTTPTLLKGAITCGCVQVEPPSVDLTNASCALLRVPWKGVLGCRIRSVIPATVAAQLANPASQEATVIVSSIHQWRL